MTGKRHRVSAAQAVQMVEAYMNPIRLLEGREDSSAEIVGRVESLIDEGRTIPAGLRAVAAVVKKKKKEIEANDALLKDYLNQWERGGHADLHRFSRHESGVHLFRAYLKQRAIAGPILQPRRARIHAALKSWSFRDGYTAEIAEAAMLDVLDRLDPLIADVLRVCENSGRAGPATELKNLRHALRVGRGRSSYDAESETTRRAVIYRWWQVAGKKDPRSLSAIASDIANEFGISKRTALNHLKQGQAEHAALRVAFSYPKKSATPIETAKSRSTARKERRPVDRQRLNFGRRKRANE